MIERKKSELHWWRYPLIAAAIVVAVPMVAMVIALQAILWVTFHVAIWTWWCGRGHDVLFVYSDSPIWRDYIEQEILPALNRRAIVLNWSRRRRWGLSLSRMAFWFFGGSANFNPMAVVFRPLRRTQSFASGSPSASSSIGGRRLSTRCAGSCST